MLERGNKIISYIEHCNKYGMGEKYTSVKITIKEQANNKQKSGKRKEKEKGI